MTKLIQKNSIENKIYEIRGKQVMLDSDLAKLYQCVNGTKTVNQAVKRNIERFPEDFCFKLTKDEYLEILRSQFGTLELKQGKYSKYMPNVFTEQGCVMLASVLKTEIAINMSIEIVRAFVFIKRHVNSTLLNLNNINMMLIKHDEEISKLKEIFSKFKEQENHVFYAGQIMTLILK